MTAAEGLLTALERNWEMVDGALTGLDDATLARCPTEQCNSIAWLLWHMTRVLDTFVQTRLQAQPQRRRPVRVVPRAGCLVPAMARA